MPVQCPVEELPAIVRVEVFHDIRHGCFQFPQLCQHGLTTLVPNGSVLGPATEKLSKREGINIIAFGGVIAMSHSVGFDRTGSGRVWRPRTSRHRMAQDRARTGGADPFLEMLKARRTQQTVYLRRADR